jgi:hypothetical protein
MKPTSTTDDDVTIPVNTNTSFNLDNWPQDLQLDADRITVIDPNLVSHQTISQTPALSTIPDIVVTPSDLPAITPYISGGCAITMILSGQSTISTKLEPPSPSRVTALFTQ